MRLSKFLAKAFFCEEEDLGCVLLHMPVGVLAVFLFYYCSPWLGLLFGWGFVVFEKVERREMPEDKASPAIQGLLWGIGITAVVSRIILWLVGG